MRWISAQESWFCYSQRHWICLNYCLCQARVPHLFTILVRTLEMPLNNKARAANLIITRPSYFEYIYPRMSILQSLLDLIDKENLVGIYQIIPSSVHTNSTMCSIYPNLDILLNSFLLLVPTKFFAKCRRGSRAQQFDSLHQLRVR